MVILLQIDSCFCVINNDHWGLRVTLKTHLNFCLRWRAPPPGENPAEGSTKGLSSQQDLPLSLRSISPENGKEDTLKTLVNALLAVTS